MPNMRADRFMYLPSLPACLGLVALTLALARRLTTHLGDRLAPTPRPLVQLAPLADHHAHGEHEAADHGEAEEQEEDLAIVERELDLVLELLRH